MRVVLVLGLLMLCACSDGGDRVFGTVERDRLTLTAPVGDLVAAVAVSEGQQVKAGQVLLQLDDTAAKARVGQAQAELARAKAALEELTNGARAEELAQARAALDGALATLIEARQQYERTERLFKSHVLTQDDLDKAKAGRDKALAGRDQAAQHLKELENGTRQEQLRQAEAQVAATQAQLDEANKALKDLTLVAGKDAVVDVLPWRAGDRVAAGTQLVSLVATDRPYVRAYLPATDLTKVKVGDKLQLKVDGQQDTLTGVVRNIRSQPAFTPYYALNERDRARLMYLTDIDLGAEGAKLPTGLALEVVLP
ncbi:HlyD family efflux transporter periplasmic adaptor subunit [Gallaecimonas kandeliae]|uniref:HlyD family secretion protein n=1 Tax=Gallaecimonas kandeliae TaxID=3029055 RepID=UPI002648380D|nr:HlyD family efflux transporter periplasmic adaptor subunit [Gallaecimonas kandeliae]WKE67354.1 HlyD family efflux transporter periplasmic adaptor subunit [Gallaecimonas kandeliae]